jgi:hypothetical protein
LKQLDDADEKVSLALNVHRHASRFASSSNTIVSSGILIDME